MKTRIIQRDPEPDGPHTSGNGAATPPRPPAHNLAARMARWSGRHRRKAILGWLAFVLVTFYVGTNVVVQKDISDVDQYSGESRDAEHALEDAGLRPTEEVVFVQSDELTVEDPEFQAAVEDVTGRISQIRYVENVESPLTGDGEISADGHAALVQFEIAGDSTETKDRVAPTLDAVAAVQADHPDLAIEQFGGASVNEAIDKVIQDDLGKAGLLSIPITLIILIITFGTLVAAGLPLLIGITSVMAALGVDYSLFYLRREREERAAGRSEPASLVAAAATSGRAVLISGVTVIVAMAGMFISGDKSFVSFAVGTILVVAIAVFASLTILPAGGLLVALAIPALGLKSVTSGVDDFPQDVPVIQTYNKVKEVFPTEGVTATAVVEADDVRSGPAAAGIAELVADVDGSDAFRPGTEVIYSEDGTVAQINVPTRGNGTDEASVAALGELRDEIIPATLGGVEGTTVNVTGDAAGSEDFANQLNSRLPLIFAFVFGLAFLLLLVTFRSIVIPIKAIVLNLLSVGAAYGVLVLVFQNGNGESLLGFTSNGGGTNWLPLFLFVVLFGLSMDYHVFILSRVKELYDRGMSTDQAG